MIAVTIVETNAVIIVSTRQTSLKNQFLHIENPATPKIQRSKRLILVAIAGVFFYSFFTVFLMQKVYVVLFDDVIL